MLIPLMFLLACGGDDDDNGSDGAAGGNTFSCFTPDPNFGGTFCADYTGSDWSEGLAMVACQDANQVFSTSLCDRTDALFRCDTSLGLPAEQIGWYFGAVAEVTAQSHCEGALMGTFNVL
jgi:hypothetical protein